MRKGMQVVPLASSVPAPTKFDLVPSQPLPVLDLDVTFKAQFLSPRMLQRFDNCLRHKRAIRVAFMLGLIGSVTFYVTPKSVGGIGEVLSALAALPLLLDILGVIRMHIVRLQLASHEFWFFSLINTMAWALCARWLDGWRAAIAINGWLGIQSSVLMDANPELMSRWALEVAASALAMCVAFTEFSLRLVPGVHDFAVFRYDTHYLPVQAVIVNAIGTVSALIARNAFRIRKMFLHGASALHVVECASLRARLVLQPHNGKRPCSNASTMPCSSSSTASTRRRSTLRNMCTMVKLDAIDARRTMLPSDALQTLDRCCGPRRLQMLAALAIFIAIVAGPIDNLVIGDPHFPMQSAAVSLALIYQVLVLARCQRQLLVEVFTSFDCVFFLIQLITASLCLCDLFEWHRSVVLPIVLVWLWVQTVLVGDALLPPYRYRLGVGPFLATFVLGMLLVATGFAVFKLIFSPDSEHIRDRTIFHVTFLRITFEMTVAPLFYNNLVTVIGWTPKIMYRLLSFQSNELVMIDGQVSYEYIST